MQILITGGFGFVGERLVDHLSKMGYEIIIGSRKLSKSSSLSKNIEVRQMIWNDNYALEKSCAGIDVIVHAAGLNAKDCEINPKAALEFNGEVTRKFYKIASHAGVKKFIYLSTAHVYSNPLEGLISEETIPTNQHPYASSNLAGERAILNDKQFGKIQGIVLRISNSFGAPVSNDANCWILLVNDLCKQAVLTKKMILKSSKLILRDFISLTQVCKIIEFFASDKYEFNNSTIFNIGSGNSQTIFSVAKLIQERCKIILGFKPSLVIQTFDSDDNHENSKLIYNIDKLLGLGIEINNNQKVKEIDNLLLFCDSNFKKKDLI